MRKPRGLLFSGRAAAGSVEGDSWAGLLKPFFFCSIMRVVLNSFPFILPLVFLTIVALEDDNDGDGGLAY
ncbi:hypothetical protein Peur_006447 [Populus x canadensis]